MSQVNVLVHSFNNGEASRAALNRVDQKALSLFAERHENLFPYTIGKAMMRPGTQYLGTTDNAYARLIPFKRSIAARALMEFGYSVADSGTFRARISDTLITRPAVATTITNGSFATAGGGWTLTAPSGTTATMNNGLFLTALALGPEATAVQTPPVADADIGVEHALRIVVTAGPVQFRVGSTVGGDEYIRSTTLETGTHSLAFTPTVGAFQIRFATKTRYRVSVGSVAIEAAGTMLLPGGWNEETVQGLRTDQSLDVVFGTADETVAPFQIERRNSGRSWSSVEFRADDGPFKVARTENLRLSNSVNRGDGTLTASSPFFTQAMVGQLMQATHESTFSSWNLAAFEESTAPVRVVGINGGNTDGYDDRSVTVQVSGTFVGTVVIERSFDSEFTGFEPYGAQPPITAPGSVTFSDEDDNAIIWYRVRMSAYTSGVATVQVSYGQDGKTGIARITAVASSTSASIRIVEPFSDIYATDDWLEGEWSMRNGYPTAVTLYDGRLWFARGDRFWGSVSDSYYSYSVLVEGDSSSVQRNVATGGDFSDVNWMLPLQRLLFGTSGAEISARSSSFDEPLTPSNVTLKPASTQGGANLNPIKIDSRGVFIHRSLRKLYQIAYDFEANDYTTGSLMDFNDDLGLSNYPTTDLEGVLSNGSFVDLAVARQPETYIFIPRDDGVCLVMFFVPQTRTNENAIQCWFKLITGEGNTLTLEPQDKILAVTVMPAPIEDEVYFTVRRSIVDADGEQVYDYYIEKLRRHSDGIQRGYNTDTDRGPRGVYTRNGSYQADCHTTTTGTGSTAQVISVPHLAGREVIVIGQHVHPAARYGPVMDSEGEVALFTVNAAGNFTLTTAMTGTITVGLPYEGRWLSSKLAYGTEEGSALLQKKHVEQLGLNLIDTHWDSLRLGRSFDDYTEMDELPRITGRGEYVDEDAFFDSTVDDVTFPFPGVWDTDSRIAVLVRAGFSATLSTVVFGVETNEK